LYDTYGFPVDLTEVICRERGLSVDLSGYEQALGEARRRSEFKGVDQAVESVYRDALGALPSGGVVFSGYEQESDESEIQVILSGGRPVDESSAGAQAEIVTARTCFYGESGGQVGDAGVICAGDARFV